MENRKKLANKNQVFFDKNFKKFFKEFYFIQKANRLLYAND